MGETTFSNYPERALYYQLDGVDIKPLPRKALTVEEIQEEQDKLEEQNNMYCICEMAKSYLYLLNKSKEAGSFRGTLKHQITIEEYIQTVASGNADE